MKCQHYLAIMTIAVLFAVVSGTVMAQSPPLPEPPDKCRLVSPIEGGADSY